jgi:transcriptional regulator of arginine metabolism
MKRVRQQKILQLIKEHPITSQRDLVRALAAAGFKVTQATVSRDIRELGLVKVAADGRLRYVAPRTRRKGDPDEARFRRLIRDAVVDVETSENLVVVKTFPGAAQGVASAIDQVEWPGVVGTVAGDDTFLIVVKPRSRAAEVRNRLRALLAGEKRE